MRLRHAHEPLREPPEPGVIERSALDTQRAVYVSDRVLGKTELAKKLGTYQVKCMRSARVLYIVRVKES